MWVVWKNINDCIFNYKLADTAEMLEQVQLVSWKWFISRKAKGPCLLYEWKWSPLDCFNRWRCIMFCNFCVWLSLLLCLLFYLLFCCYAKCCIWAAFCVTAYLLLFLCLYLSFPKHILCFGGIVINKIKFVQQKNLLSIIFPIIFHKSTLQTYTAN
jgi:hypothetical protein